MASRLELQAKFEELLGTSNAYYQPPSSVRMNYTAIRYSKKDIWTTVADNRKYSKMTCYEVIVISQRPDDPVVDKILELPYCSYDRHYVINNLYHDVLTLYF